MRCCTLRSTLFVVFSIISYHRSTQAHHPYAHNSVSGHISTSGSCWQHAAARGSTLLCCASPEVASSHLSSFLCLIPCLHNNDRLKLAPPFPCSPLMESPTHGTTGSSAPYPLPRSENSSERSQTRSHLKDGKRHLRILWNPVPASCNAWAIQILSFTTSRPAKASMSSTLHYATALINTSCR